jgi:hypothetical protein
MDEQQQGRRARRRRGRRGRGGTSQPEEAQRPASPPPGPPGPGAPAPPEASAPRPPRRDTRGQPHAERPEAGRGRTHRAPPTTGRDRGSRDGRGRRDGGGDERDRDRDRDRGRLFEPPVPQDPVSIELGAKFREAQNALRDARKALDKRKAEFGDEPDWMSQQYADAEHAFEEAATAWHDHLSRTGRKMARR